MPPGIRKNPPVTGKSEIGRVLARSNDALSHEPDHGNQRLPHPTIPAIAVDTTAARPQPARRSTHVLFEQPQRDSNPCRHLERMSDAVRPVLSDVVPWCLSRDYCSRRFVWCCSVVANVNRFWAHPLADPLADPLARDGLSKFERCCQPRLPSGWLPMHEGSTLMRITTTSRCRCRAAPARPHRQGPAGRSPRIGRPPHLRRSRCGSRNGQG